MQVAQKHLFVTVAQDNLDPRVPQARQARQAPQEQLVAVAVAELEHDLVLVHLVSVHVTMPLR
jgi:electron transfer flavoprotein alpha/beta subunit